MNTNNHNTIQTSVSNDVQTRDDTTRVDDNAHIQINHSCDLDLVHISLNIYFHHLIPFSSHNTTT